MINAGKKLFNIAFKHITGAGIIFTDSKLESAKTTNRFVYAFIITAGKRISNKCFIKEGIQNTINGMV